ncbi:MAG: NrtR DNA-binding winged helix domain-containing protein, partial [Ferruginibacter sp.]
IFHCVILTQCRYFLIFEKIIFSLQRIYFQLYMTNKSIFELLNTGEGNFLPSLSVDCVIFGFHEYQLKVLLVKHRHLNKWALPGGFIGKQEPADSAAYRVLKERTGLNEIFLQQFHVFGEPERSKKEFHLMDLKKDGIQVNEDHWILQRFVTIGYYALVEFSKVNPSHDILSEKIMWWDIHKIPALILDHRKILDKALATLRMQLNYQPIGYNLLPDKFTMAELQKLYETIIDKNLDRRNFQRKIMGFKILKRLTEIKKGVPHKSPYLYSFDLEKYNAALNEGFNVGW